MEIAIAITVIAFSLFYLASQFNRKEHPGLQLFFLTMGISFIILGFSFMSTASMNTYQDTRQNATPLLNEPYDLRGDLDVVIEDVQVYNVSGPPGNLVTTRGFIDNSNYTVENNEFVLLEPNLNNTKMSILFSHKKPNSNSNLLSSARWISILILVIVLFYFILFMIKNLLESFYKG